MLENERIDPQLLAKWNLPVPRYTSYPTAPQFYPVSSSEFKEKLIQFGQSQKPLSLYLHIPFCQSMCLFCGCSVVLNRSAERQSSYLAHLLREIEMTCQVIGAKKRVDQIHFGGGTPTSLSEKEFDLLFSHIHRHFQVAKDAEICIEIDPRTVFHDQGQKLIHLRNLGVNRVSFGVQDLDPKVQEAIRRRQTEEMTVQTYLKARELGFESINIDLIYGLPHQTPDRFSKTIESLLRLRPDRIAFYSYAKVPWLKPHQKAIPDATLPSLEEKFEIYTQTRESLLHAGYVQIGMDHFGLSEDSITKAYFEKKLTRNFQGYSVQKAEDMLGFGITSIGFLENCYFQNVKDLSSYESSIDRGELPVHLGFFLKSEDLLRKEAIESLMCHFELDKSRFGHLADFSNLIKEELLVETNTHFVPTPLGRLLIRVIAARVDSYLSKGQFSRAI